jgi:hypothetical protein
MCGQSNGIDIVGIMLTNREIIGARLDIAKRNLVAVQTKQNPVQREIDIAQEDVRRFEFQMSLLPSD